MVKPTRHSLLSDDGLPFKHFVFFYTIDDAKTKDWLIFGGNTSL
jgi:hypothetical protein